MINSQHIGEKIRKNLSTHFDRYRPILNDWTAFQACLTRPLPTCIWTNTLRTTPGHLADILTADNIKFETVPWYPGAFKLPPDFKPGHHWAFLAGLYHVQEEVALLPVMLLDPQPGERILDLCAAPGNKSAQIAVMMKSRGTVVANDINSGRMRAVRQALERLGLVNVTTTTGDGANYPKDAGLFDRVLVDVPCSCEGTSRKEPGVLDRAGAAFGSKLNGLQLALLRKAVQRCKPGGRIVYATCTYAPEENEAVVDTIVREFGSDTVRVVPAEVRGFAVDTGLTRWQDQQFAPSLRHSLRVWPHQNDTGGFYVAVLEKGGPVDATESPPVRRDFEAPPIAKDILELLENRFGISPQVFEPYTLFQRGKKRSYIVTHPHHPPAAPRPDAIGMAFVNTDLKYPKLSTAAAQAFGSHATQNFIELTAAQAQATINRQNIEVSAEQCRHCTGEGYVLVKHRGFVLGVAVYYPNVSGGGRLQNMFPKGWSPNKNDYHLPFTSTTCPG